MRLSDIVNQLSIALPSLVDDFTNQISVTSLTRSGTTVSAICSSNHSLSVGGKVVINGAQTPISVTSLNRVGIVARIILGSDHDITENAGYDVQLSGFNESEFNGTFPLSSVPNRRTLDITVADSGPTTGTGTPLLLNGSSALKSYNGIQNITAITSPTVFQYEVSDTTLFTPASGTITAKILPRISSAVDIERIEQAYTKQDSNKAWLFVTLGDAVADKNRNIDTDSTDNIQSGNFFNQRIIQAVQLFVFFPASGEIAATQARDRCEELLRPICNSILTYKFPSLVENSNNPLMLIGHGTQGYNSAYYVHRYDFEATLQLGISDIYQPADHVALRDISLSDTLSPGSGEDPITAEIDLDDEIL